MATGTASVGIPAASGEIGARLRAEREGQKIGVRELAKRVGVSASLISQIETGKSRPSVSTLYSIVSELQISLDELFAGGAPPVLASVPAEPPADQPLEPPARRTAPNGPVQSPGSRQVVQLESGVTWERLTAAHDPIDFLYVTYPVGADSCPPDALMRHRGREYGYVLEGRLGITVAFNEYELGPGDSISFDSPTPHRLRNLGDEPVRAIWFVVGRHPDAEHGGPGSTAQLA